MYKYVKRVSGVGNSNYIYFWKSKGLSDENIATLTISGYKLNPKLSYFASKTRAEFNESCLKQDKATYDHGKIVSIYIVCEIINSFNTSRFLTLGNCLFGIVGLTKKYDIDNHKYSGYDSGFDRHFFSHASDDLEMKIKFPTITEIVRSVFENDEKFYPQM